MEFLPGSCGTVDWCEIYRIVFEARGIDPDEVGWDLTLGVETECDRLHREMTDPLARKKKE